MQNQKDRECILPHKQVAKTMEEKQQNNEQIKTLIEDVLAFGDLLEIANKGIGKTNALMVLTREFRNLEDTRVIVFEDFPKWIHEFDKMPYFIIKDSDVVETSHTLDVEDYFLRHERDYSVNRGSEIQQALEENKDLIFVSEITDIERQAFFIYSVVQYFYRKAYLRKFKNYGKTERVIFIIEESQNVFDSSTISKKIFNRLRKIFSVARNLDLHFVLASQRLQDLNTKIRGRTRLLLGQVSLDDYELKIRRLLRHSKHKEGILTLERGSFLYPSLDVIVKFPKFEANGKPYEWKPKTETKPKEYKGILGKLRKAIDNHNRKAEERKRGKVYLDSYKEDKSVYDDSEETDSEIEEDALAEEEFFSESEL